MLDLLGKINETYSPISGSLRLPELMTAYKEKIDNDITTLKQLKKQTELLKTLIENTGYKKED